MSLLDFLKGLLSKKEEKPKSPEGKRKQSLDLGEMLRRLDESGGKNIYLRRKIETDYMTKKEHQDTLRIPENAEIVERYRLEPRRYPIEPGMMWDMFYKLDISRGADENTRKTIIDRISSTKDEKKKQIYVQILKEIDEKYNKNENR